MTIYMYELAFIVFDREKGKKKAIKRIHSIFSKRTKTTFYLIMKNSIQEVDYKLSLLSYLALPHTKKVLVAFHCFFLSLWMSMAVLVFVDHT